MCIFPQPEIVLSCVAPGRFCEIGMDPPSTWTEAKHRSDKVIAFPTFPIHSLPPTYASALDTLLLLTFILFDCFVGGNCSFCILVVVEYFRNYATTKVGIHCLVCHQHTKMHLQWHCWMSCSHLNQNQSKAIHSRYSMLPSTFHSTRFWWVMSVMPNSPMSPCPLLSSSRWQGERKNTTRSASLCCCCFHRHGCSHQFLLLLSSLSLSFGGRRRKIFERTLETHVVTWNLSKKHRLILWITRHLDVGNGSFTNSQIYV